MNADFFVWNFDPTIFHFWILAPRWYGLCFAIAILSGYQIMRWIYEREGFTEEVLNKGFVLFVIGTIVGARLGHCLFYEPEHYLMNPLKILYIWEGGLASHGGTIGIILCMLYYCSKDHVPFMWLADRLSVAIALGVPFIRIGNFFNSEIIGRPTDVPWAIVFAHVDNIPRHPAQLYEALSYFLLFGILMTWYLKKAPNIRSGSMIGFLFMWIFGSRIFIEYFKENQVAFENNMTLNMGQILSIPFVILGLFLMLGLHTKLFPQLDQLGVGHKMGKTPKHRKKLRT